MELNSDLLRRLSRVYDNTLDPVFDATFNLGFYEHWNKSRDGDTDTDLQLEGLAGSWCELYGDEIDSQLITENESEETVVSNWLLDALDNSNFTCVDALSHDARLSYVEHKIVEWVKENVGNGITLSYTFHAMSGWGERYKLSDDYSVIDAWSKGDFATLTVRFHDPDKYPDKMDSVDLEELVDTVSKPIEDGDTDVQMMYLYSNHTAVTDNHGLEYHPVSYFHARFATDEGMEKFRDLVAEEHFCAEIKFRRSGESEDQIHSVSMRLPS